jgi:uncharacterized NAD(P)/FAD-binding protein YdhS
MLAKEWNTRLVEFSTMRNTLAIVGGGFSGTVLAAKLLRRPPSDATDIVLIERGPSVGRGVAYAARRFPYLLNVRRRGRPPIPRDALQFLHFEQRRIPDADGEDFLPRALYGDYLQDLLSRAERAAPAHVRLLRITGEVRRVVPGDGDGAFMAEFADRPPMAADRVILALGNPPPALLPWAAAIRDHAAYRHDPWDLPKTLSAEHSGADRRQWFDHGGRSLFDPGPGARTRAAYNFAARRGAAAADRISRERSARRRRALLACADSLRRCWP